jgi:Rrf2 family protein
MSHYGAAVEYGLHCLLLVADRQDDAPPSARDLADFQGISPSYVAKIFTALEKAGLLTSEEGRQGGFRLARPAGKISALDVVQAIEGDKPLFQCREIRRNCILYGPNPPGWASDGVCRIHGLMLDAERQMRAVLKRTTIADLRDGVAVKTPAVFADRKSEWFEQRRQGRAGRKD